MLHSDMYPLRAISRLVLAITPLMIITALASPASAATAACDEKLGDADITSCTQAIDSGTLQGHDLAAAYVSRGRAWYGRLDFGRALADFNAAIRLDPADAAAYEGRGLAFQFHPERAIIEFDEAIRLDPRYVAAYLDRSAAFRAMHVADRAIADANAALRLDPANADAALARGRAWRLNSDLDRAIADFSEAIRLKATDINAWFDRGRAYQAKGDLDRAIADYDETIRLGAFTRAYVARGDAYRAKNDLDRAIADYDAAIRHVSYDAAAFQGRGLARQAKGDAAGAAADFAEARRLTTVVAGLSVPAFTRLHLAIGLLAILSGAIVVLGMLRGRVTPRATAPFLAATAVASAAGFLFPRADLGPVFDVSILAFAAAALAGSALYLGRLAGHWRWVFVLAAVGALYLDVHVALMQAILRLPSVMLLLPRSAEPPFLAVPLTALAVFVVLAFAALRRYRPAADVAA